MVDHEFNTFDLIINLLFCFVLFCFVLKTLNLIFYVQTSNGDVFEKTHDELDIEFLGNIKGKPWRFQTNLYGNGSTHRGREERYLLWFDPSKEFHRYSILWTPHKIM